MMDADLYGQLLIQVDQSVNFFYNALRNDQKEENDLKRKAS